MIDTNHLYPAGISSLFPDEAVKSWIEKGEEILVKKGDLIIKPEGLSDYTYLILEGNAHIFHIHEDGKECVIGILSKGDFIHLFDIFTERDSRVIAKALTDVKISIVHKEEIKKVVSENSSLSMKLLSDFSLRLQEMVEILSQVAYGKVEERLLFLFEKLADRDKGESGWFPIPVSVTHQDLAGMVASTRETVTLLINKLLQTGVIRQKDNKIWMRIK